MYLSKRFAALSPQKKRRARIRLYGGLTVLIGLVVLIVLFLGRPMRHGADDIADLDKLRGTEEVKLLQDYIRIDTSTTTGSEIDGAEFLARHLENSGLQPHIERLGEGKANLWAILEGESEEAIVLHNHIDVYDAGDPDAWEFPPFGGVIDKVWLYGRGAFDMKSLAIAQLLSMADLARDAKRPRKSVIFLASGSEEVGSDLGSRWILASHPELARRFALVLTEGGVVEAVSREEIKYWGIEFAQKWIAELWACAGSRERLEALHRDLLYVSDTNHNIRIPNELREFVGAYARSRSSETARNTLSDLERTLHHADEFGRLPRYIKALFRDETAPFEIEPDPMTKGYRMKILLHLLPGSDLEESRRILLPDWVTHGVSLTFHSPAGTGPGSPVDHPAFETIREVVQDTHPDAAVGPYFLAWSATDARFFREWGISSYGFSPFLIFATDTFRRDTLNERIDIKGYVEGVAFYKEIVRRLAG